MKRRYPLQAKKQVHVIIKRNVSDYLREVERFSKYSRLDRAAATVLLAVEIFNTWGHKHERCLGTIDQISENSIKSHTKGEVPSDEVLHTLLLEAEHVID